MDQRNKGKPAGISPEVAEYLRKLDEALSRLGTVEAVVNDKSQWNHLARSWIGKTVVVNLLTGKIVIGKLITLDRYTLVIHGGYEQSRDESEVIIHKGAIATIQLGE